MCACVCAPDLHMDLLNVLSSDSNLGLLGGLEGVLDARLLSRESCLDSDRRIMHQYKICIYNILEKCK